MKESQRSERILAYFSYLNEARQQAIEEMKNTRNELVEQKTTLVAKQNQQKTLLCEQQMVELRQNEIRLRDKIVRAEREAPGAAKVHAKEQQAKKTGTPYQPSGADRSLMARIGGLGRTAGQAVWPVRGFYPAELWRTTTWRVALERYGDRSKSRQ